MKRVLLVFALGVSGSIAACVSESGVPSDAGPDTNTPMMDGAVDSGADGGADASGPACDPKKPFGTLVPVMKLNDPNFNAGGAHLTPDGLTVLFSSDRAGGALNIQLFKATRTSTSADWATPVLLPNINANTKGGMNPTWIPDGVITSDGKTLLYTYDAPFRYHIYKSTRANVGVDFPVGAPEPALNPKIADGGAGVSGFDMYLLPDDKTLYYSAGEWLHPTLYVSTLSSTGWTTPQQLASLNSGTTEQYVAVTPDQLTIYFGSSRETSNPALHKIYVATRADVNQPFGNISAVTELNSSNPMVDQGPSWISSDGCTIWVSNSSTGKLQIYSATKPK